MLSHCVPISSPVARLIGRQACITYRRKMTSVAEIHPAGGDNQDRMEVQRHVSPSIPRRAPISLPDYAKNKGHFSVTELTSPSWCEYAYQYGVLGMRHLPVSQRPKEIIAPSGHVVKPDIATVKQREKILKGGRKVHERLEKEVHPVKVVVQTTSKEERWGLRILRIVTGLHTLMESGCCRELPVFGFIEGKLVMGVIDEISRRPLSRRLNAYFDEVEATNREASATLQHFFPVSEPSQRTPPVSPEKKQWSSQEEWRKAKRKNEQAAKLSKKREKKAPSVRSTNLDPKQNDLGTFFGGAKAIHTESTTEHTEERFGYFLEDSKTRKGQLVPPIEDQFQARMQCMLYKRLFDGLLAGAFSGDGDAKSKEAEALAMDEFAKPLKVDYLFATLGLDVDATLSEGFVHDAEILLQGYNMTIQPLDPATNAKVACTLNAIGELLGETLRALARSAQAGLKWVAPSEQRSGVLQSRLRLTYRHRNQKSRKAEFYASLSRKRQPDRAAKKGQGSVAEETLESAVTKEVGMDTGIEQSALEYEILRDNGVVVPDSSNESAPARGEISGGDDSGVEAVVSKGKEKIATVTFLHDAAGLNAYLLDMLRLWNGQRELRGVTLEQSWRCHTCEFRKDCEWREAKGKEKLDEVTQTRLARQMADRAAAENSESLSSSESESQTQQGEGQDEAQVAAISRSNMDDEDSLWSQFEVIADEKLEW